MLRNRRFHILVVSCCTHFGLQSTDLSVDVVLIRYILICSRHSKYSCKTNAIVNKNIKFAIPRGGMGFNGWEVLILRGETVKVIAGIYTDFGAFSQKNIV